jgi:translation initiation factor 2 subunit 1
LYDSIARKMAPTPMKLRADFELQCFTYEGIDAIREALLSGKRLVDERKIIEKKGTDKEGD